MGTVRKPDDDDLPGEVVRIDYTEWSSWLRGKPGVKVGVSSLVFEPLAFVSSIQVTKQVPHDFV